MRKLSELQQEIESVRFELDQHFYDRISLIITIKKVQNSIS